MKKNLILSFALFISFSFSLVYAGGECPIWNMEIAQCGESGSYTCVNGAPGNIDAWGPGTWECAQCDSGDWSRWGENTSGCCGDTCPVPNSGTLNVSANIPGASWTITGPTILSGSGTSQSNVNQPIGAYTIIWGAASGYITPASQTLTLSDQGTLTFSGVYNPAASPTVNIYFSLLENFFLKVRSFN